MAAKGDIDTSAPFQSVKDAVMLFGTSTLSRGKHAVPRPKPDSEERVLMKETKLHLALEELNRLKEKIKNSETTKVEALLELEKAKKVVDDLLDKVRAAESATRAIEVTGNQGKQKKRADSAQKQDLDSGLGIRTNNFSELDEKKQELWKISQNMRNLEGIDLDSVRLVTSNLDFAKESLQKVAEEESGLCKMLVSLKLELNNVQKEHAELIEKERETEAIVRDLHAQLQKNKTDLEMCLEESKASEALGETFSTTEMKAEAEELRKEAEDIKIKLRELEEDLQATECVLSERTDVAETSSSESDARITISREKFDSLRKKAEEFSNSADIKVATALAEVHATRVCMDEALNTLEMSQREIEDLQAARIEALKKAEAAEGARRAVEAELKRWREREQKKAAEIATRILAETEIPVKSSPQHSKIQKRNSKETLQKSKTHASKKVLLPSVSGIFHRRKNPNETRFASCLPN